MVSLLSLGRRHPLLISVIIVVAFAAPAFAQDGTQGEAGIGAGLTLEKAIEMALSTSASLRSAEIDLQLAQLALKEAETNSLTNPSPTALYQARTNVAIAEKNYELAKYNLKSSVEEAYYAVIRAERTVEVNAEALKLAQEQLALAKLKLETGVVAEIDVMKAASRVATVESNLEAARRNRDLALLKFRQLVGAPDDAVLSLTEQFDYEPTEIDVDEAVNVALANRVEISRAKATVEMREKELQLATNSYTPKLTQEKARLNLEKAKLDLEQQIADIILEVRQNYAAIKDAESRIKLLEMTLREAEENLRITQLKLEAEMATNLDVMDAQATVTETKTNLINALFDYNVAKARFFRSLGTGGE